MVKGVNLSLEIQQFLIESRGGVESRGVSLMCLGWK